MESKWLEDFLALADSRSFSKAAVIRNVTQPSFSRRIKSLESWLGADLVDRSRFPVQLTDSGEAFRQEAAEMLAHLRKLRGALGDELRSDDVIEFALPHNLSLTFFPAWLRSVTDALGPIKSRVRADNVLAAVTRLTEGACDLLLCYHHPLHPLALDPNKYDVTVIGREQLRPYVSARAVETGSIVWPGTVRRPIPLLAYSSDAYLSHIAALILKRCRPRLSVERVFETDMAECLKIMASEGHGVAILPDSAVRREIRSRQLVPLGDVSEEIEVRAYRAKPGAGASHGSGAAAKLWAHLG